METFTKLWNVLNKVTKMKDSIMVSLVGGIIGTLVMESSSFILWKTKKTELMQGHIAGSFFMRAFRTNQTKNFVLGEILHMVVGATLGIPIFQLLKRTGKDHHVLKGAFVGMVAWSGLYNLGTRLSLFTAKPHLTKSFYSALFNHLLFGITTAQAIITLADPSLFSQQNQPLLAQNSAIESQTVSTIWQNDSTQAIDPSIGLQH
ncbi:conserved membrane hypothetical protein [Candidatus Desulfosporosinus infrequens]|uniref:Uncharacterized protein n=1 Tax=Candidatus Desulfosporosinus infrequens TaxID=2043169 RepID=A0A2U3JWK6_9FIRM|nr:conserved membrane hypothetical protein [Candidatus Desulfosporosinus infrequens]